MSPNRYMATGRYSRIFCQCWITIAHVQVCIVLVKTPSGEHLVAYCSYVIHENVIKQMLYYYGYIMRCDKCVRLVPTLCAHFHLSELNIVAFQIFISSPNRGCHYSDRWRIQHPFGTESCREHSLVAPVHRIRRISGADDRTGGRRSRRDQPIPLPEHRKCNRKQRFASDRLSKRALVEQFPRVVWWQPSDRPVPCHSARNETGGCIRQTWSSLWAPILIY